MLVVLWYKRFNFYSFVLGKLTMTYLTSNGIANHLCCECFCSIRPFIEALSKWHTFCYRQYDLHANMNSRHKLQISLGP